VETVAINTPSVQATARLDRTRRTSCSTASKNMTHLPPNRGEHKSQHSRSQRGLRGGTGGNVGKPASTGMKRGQAQKPVARSLRPGQRSRMGRPSRRSCRAAAGPSPRTSASPPFHERVTATSAGATESLSSIPAVYPPVDWGTNPARRKRLARPLRHSSSRCVSEPETNDVETGPAPRRDRSRWPLGQSAPGTNSNRQPTVTSAIRDGREAQRSPPAGSWSHDSCRRCTTPALRGP